MRNIGFINKFGVYLLIFALFFTEVFGVGAVALAANFERAQVVRPEGEQREVYDLVVLLVDKRIREDAELERRVNRYAEDIKENYPMTDVQFLFMGAGDEIYEAAMTLEALYRNGAGRRLNKMTGVVVIGDLPLPVVNKNGNRFVSMLPYTDFEDKAYVFNEDKGSFDFNGKTPKAEVWHGVIKGSREDLIGFFDKNNAYYSGDPQFSEFDKKVFFGDLVAAEEQMNEDAYRRYLQYLKYAEDLAYNRYNKQWARDLTGEVYEDLELDEDYVDEDFIAALQNEEIFDNLPDIHSKSIIDQFLIPYYKIFNRYNSSLNDWVDYTGRYKTGDVDSVMKLITAKDEYARFYLKEVNTALEAQIDDVISRISEPLPVLEGVILSGEFRNEADVEPFQVQVFNENNVGSDPIFEAQELKFHYKNPANDKLYINGVDARLLNSPLLCSVYLGSENEIEDRIGVLTRSLRSDNLTTGFFMPVVGANLVSAEGGYMIKGEERYGVAPFFESTLGDDGVSAFEEVFQEGDVLQAINGRLLTGAYTVDQAILENYENLSEVIKAVNDEEFERLNNFEGKMMVRLPNADDGQDAVVFYNNRAEVMGAERLRIGRVRSVVGYLDINYLRDGESRNVKLTFTVTADGPVLFPSRGSASGSEAQFPEKLPVEIVVVPRSMNFPLNFRWGSGSDGAIFGMYDNERLGYNGKPLGPDAGCNANSTSRNSDRCLGKFATIPVLDPAGSRAPSWMNIPGQGMVRDFFNRVKMDGEGNNSVREIDYLNAVDLYDFYYEDFGRVDEFLLNSCFGFPLASYAVNGEDSNPYSGHVIAQIFDDIGENQLGGNRNNFFDKDFYGRLLYSVAKFAAGELADDVDYVNGADIRDGSDFNPSREIWAGTDKLTVDDVVIHDFAGVRVSLKLFADHYGLFDGKDNNGNGIADFAWVDSDGDGVADKRVYDFAEADPSAYGIGDQNLAEVARRLFSKSNTLVIPYSDPDFPAEWKVFDRDLVLRVRPRVYEGRTISSLIEHKEPTNYTIMKQLVAGTTLDMPIDNPRYVAFLSEELKGAEYPEPQPINNEVDVEAILAGLERTQHRAVGEVKRVDYINLFDEGVSSFAAMQVGLLSKANEIAALPGSYRIFGVEAREEDYEKSEIAEEVFVKYLLPTVTSLNDVPLTVFDLKRANSRKLADALSWKGMNIDEKNHYVLKNYLSGNEGDNPYISKPQKGYEASYLVLDGSEETFSLSFSREVQEDDGRFDRMSRLLSAVNEEEVIVADANENDPGFEFVWLDEFLDELKRFSESFTYEPNFEQACGYNEYLEAILNGQERATEQKLERIELSAQRTKVKSGGDLFSVKARGFDEDGNLILRSNDPFSLELNQAGEVAVIDGESTAVLNGGEVMFSFLSESEGIARMNVVSQSGVRSNTVQVVVSDKRLEVNGEKFLKADGEEKKTVEVVVKDGNGRLINDRELSVAVSSEKGLFEVAENGVINNGVLKLELLAGTVSGVDYLEIEVLNDGSFPVLKEEIILEAGDPSMVDVVSDSFVLVANGVSKTTLDLAIKDRFGNIVNNDFSQIAVFADRNVVLDNKNDVNPQLAGVQLNTFEGRASVDVFARGNGGKANLIALLLDYELEEEIVGNNFDLSAINFEGRVGKAFEIEVKDNVKVVATLLDRNFREINEILADGQGVLRLGVGLYSDGEVVSAYNGPVEIELISDELGVLLTSRKQKMGNGLLNAANNRIRVNKVAGVLSLIVKVPGFAEKTVNVRLKPGEAKEVVLSLEGDYLDSKLGSEVTVVAKLVDEFGNLASEDAGKRVFFDLSEASTGLVEVLPANNVAVKGVATATLKSKGMSGEANLVARIEEEGVEEGVLNVPIRKVVGLEEVKEFNPKSLYISLWGGEFGGQMKENIAQALLFNGKTQAISSISTSNEQGNKLVAVDGYGVVENLSDNLRMAVMLSNDSSPYQKVVVSDPIGDREVMQVFVVSKAESKLKLVDKDVEIYGNLEEGVFVQELMEEEGRVLKQVGEEVVMLDKDVEVMKIDKFGRIKNLENGYDVRLINETDDFKAKHFSLIVEKRAVPVAVVVYKENFDEGIRRLPMNSALNSFFPGIYVQMLNTNDRYVFEEGFSRNSTAEKKAVYLMDRDSDLRSNMRVQVPERFGYGFEGDNKNMLLFAAGNSVGSSNLPYMAESTVIYGDPLVRVAVDDMDVSVRTGFTKDLGKPLYQSDADIEMMVDFDFNGDGVDDLLLMSKDGVGKVLENVINMDRFWDRGEVLKVFGSIKSVTKIDINNNGYDDLVIATEESCKRDEECIYLYKNNGSGFERESLDVDLGGHKVYQMQGADFNNDGCEDLVISDSAGRIGVYYNTVNAGQCTGLEKRPMRRFDFGYSLDEESNQADNLFVEYENIARVENQMIEFVVNGEDGDESLSFVHLPVDNFFRSSEKRTVDKNGGSLALGDEVEVLITLKNSGGENVRDLKISDALAPSVSLIEGSLKCLSVSCGEIGLRQTGNSLRPLIIDGVDVNAGEEVVISYSFKVEAMSAVNFSLGHDFVDYPSNRNDGYLDILVRPRNGTNGKIVYLYSGGMDPRGRVIHQYLEEAGNVGGRAVNEDGFDALRNMDFDPNDPNAIVPKGVKDEIYRLQNEQRADNDHNGLPDIWDKALNKGESAADEIANKIENGISSLRCSGGGCLPIPYNYAFLVPDGPTPGIAAIAAGIPSLPPVLPFYPSSAPSSFRFYLSPTLSGGLGTAACLGPGPGHQSPCFAFAIPPSVSGSGAICSELTSGLDEAIKSSKNAIVDPATGMATVITNGENVMNNSDLDLDFNIAGKDSPISAAGKVNIKIPGFPSVITNWVDNQIDEIYNKLLDFPDIYLILPDVSGFAASNASAIGEVSFNGFNDFARTISQIPLVQIESKPILVRVPSVSKNQVEKYKIQWSRWKDNMEKQLNDRLAFWDCDSSVDKRSVCDQIVVDVNDLLQSVQKLMDNVDKLANFPRDLLNYRNLEAKYANQIVCYLDAVTAHTGGYIKKQGTTVESWMKAVEDAVRTFQDWRIVLDLMVDYQSSCDQCRNDRFSKLGILLEFFAALPEPPIIPIPKWPDLTVDLSNIKTGVKILWPDVTFRPEPIILPDLPEIALPEVLPNVRIDIPGFDVPDIPNLQLPNLPDLPPLPLPNLPDLPRPPRIPPLPKPVIDLVANLRPIFKILCLLKTGLVPVPEWGLATEIETLTQPNVSAVLPIIKNLGIQQPQIKYDFVREIRIEAKARFDINTDFIYLRVKEGMDRWNNKVKELIEEFNKYSRLNYGAGLSNALQNLVDQVADEVLSSDGLDVNLPGGVDVEVSRPSSVIDFEKEAQKFDEEIRKYIDQLPKHPEEYNLVAEERYLYPNDAILNRSLSEVERAIAREELVDDPLVKDLAKMRDLALGYAKDMQKKNANLKGALDLNDFNRILADDDNFGSLFASNNDVGGETLRPGKVAVSLFSEGIKEVINEAAFSKGNLLAANLGMEPAELAQAAEGATESYQAKGVYVFADGVNENVINYTFELGKKTAILFSDVDSDGDSDLIVAFGGDVYLKENYKNKDLRVNKKGEVVKRNTNISDHLQNSLPVDGLKVVALNGKILIRFEGVDRDILGYEVVLSVYKEGRERVSEAEQRFFVDVGSINDLKNPNIELEVENGHYYVSIFVVEEDGSKSLKSNARAVEPSVCMDVNAPFPVVSDVDLKLPIYSELTIDASNSFDSDGKIVSYYLESLPFDGGIGKQVTSVPQIIWSDLNVAVDTDGDGIKWNDKSNPKFRVGPFVNEGDVGLHRFVLHVEDEAGNNAQQAIEVEVVVPEISLDHTFARTQIASGEVKPMVSNLPFALMRTRYIYRVQNGELISVPDTEKIAEGNTDINGKYSMSDFEQDEMLVVEDADGRVIAEINPKSGNIETFFGARVRVYPAEVPEISTRMEIIASNGVVMATIYLVGDVNNDVIIGDGNGDGIEVSDKNTEDALIIRRVPADNRNNPGGVVLINELTGEVMVSVDAGGNILLLNEDLSLSLKNNDYKNEPVVLEVSFGEEVVLEVTLRISRNAPMIFSDENQALRASPRTVPRINPDRVLNDGANGKTTGPLAINEVIDRFGEEALVSRGEFARALLQMMCIIPREPEAYEDYGVGSGYADIRFDAENIGELYPYIKEATMLDLVEGYVGDQENGLAPFRPGGAVSRAEAVTMILRALHMKGEIEPVNAEGSGVWYEAFMKRGEEIGIIVNEEINEANRQMNYGDLLTMVRRVMTIYTCEAGEIGDIWNDDDLSDEVGTSGFDDGEGDGFDDGGEGGLVSMENGREGIFVVPAECNSCPCISTVKNKADIMSGDVFFPVIFKEYLEPINKIHIFNKGNEVVVD